jgi:GNAT superfamily N-acetyltransferase
MTGPAGGWRIRGATHRELPLLQDIENEADLRYRAVGLNMIIGMPPAELRMLEEGRRRGWLWLAVDRHDRPVGFALMRTFGGDAWLHQLSVLQSAGRRGIGRALVEAVCEAARYAGHGAVLLSTASGVPWNVPFYRRCGFEVVPPGCYTRALRQERLHELRSGHVPWRRAIMRRALAPPA